MRGADRVRRLGARACLAAALALCVPAAAAHAGSARTSDALRAALRDPGTWIPAVAALFVSLTGRDHPMTERARAACPMYGTCNSAIEASDVLRETAYVEMVATMPMVPGAESNGDTFGRVMLAEHVGMGAAMGVTWMLKRTVGRERPDGSNTHSFPSGHASRSFANRGAMVYNLERSTLAAPARTGANVVLSLAAAGCAWARVEGGAHHASDALAGAAIGNFFGRFCAEALGPDDEDPSPRAPAFPAIAVTIRF